MKEEADHEYLRIIPRLPEEADSGTDDDLKIVDITLKKRIMILKRSLKSRHGMARRGRMGLIERMPIAPGQGC